MSLQRIRQHSTETSVSRQRILDHDVGQLPEFISEVVRTMHHQFTETMIELLDETTQRSGNIVAGRGRPLRDSLEEILSKIAFGVDRYGKPSAPHVFIPPGVVKSLDELLDTLDPETKKNALQIVSKKSDEATAREARRVSRFRIVR